MKRKLIRKTFRTSAFQRDFKNVITESWHFMKNNRKARSIMIVNALIGAVSTLVLFFLQAKLPLAGLNEALLGPALFVMGLGAALGAKVVGYFPNWKYKKYVILSWNRCVVCIWNDVFRQSISDGSWRICWFFCR